MPKHFSVSDVHRFTDSNFSGADNKLAEAKICW